MGLPELTVSASLRDGKELRKYSKPGFFYSLARAKENPILTYLLVHMDGPTREEERNAI